MIFAFIEDGMLDVVENLAEAQRKYEGVDVESAVVVFYNSNGIYLEPRFTVPNKHGRFLWLFSWCTSGVYELVPNPQAPQDPIWLALYETQSLNPNRHFKTLEEVKAYLTANGAVVGKPAEP